MNLLSISLAKSGRLAPERPAESEELMAASLLATGAAARGKSIRPLHKN
jgi:hypothetical protein